MHLPVGAEGPRRACAQSGAELTLCPRQPCSGDGQGVVFFRAGRWLLRSGSPVLGWHWLGSAELGGSLWPLFPTGRGPREGRAEGSGARRGGRGGRGAAPSSSGRARRGAERSGGAERRGEQRSGRRGERGRGPCPATGGGAARGARDRRSGGCGLREGAPGGAGCASGAAESSGPVVTGCTPRAEATGVRTVHREPRGAGASLWVWAVQRQPR